MTEAFKKLSAEVKARIEESFSSPTLKALVERTKAAEDSGTFEIAISSADVDRSGEVIVQEGIDTKNYMSNPVVLFGHDYYSLPIGVCESLEMREGKTIAKGRFAPADANPFAQQCRKLYDLGILRASSVGVIVRRMEGSKIMECELLEFSFVPVPANPMALDASKMLELGIDREMLSIKGLNIEVKETPAVKAEGDTCTLENGEEGVLNAEGTCVAKPNESSAKGAVTDNIAEQDMWEKKWANLSRVCDIVDALFDAYLSDDTPVENFDILVAETATLLSGLVGSEAKAAEFIAKAIEARKTAGAGVKKYVRTKAQTKSLEEIGAELAAMQSEIDSSMSAHSMKVIEICKANGIEETPKSATKKDEGSPPDGGAPVGEETPVEAAPNKVEAAAATMVGKEFDDFQTVRSLLKAISTATGQALERINERAREARKTR